MAVSELENELSSARRFFAPTMAEAMRKLARSLGNDAMLLTSKNVQGGVEVYGIAAAEETNYRNLTQRRSARRRQRRAGRQASAAENPVSRRDGNDEQKPAITNVRSNVEHLPTVSLAAIYANEQKADQDERSPADDMAQSFLQSESPEPELHALSEEQLVSTLLEDDWMQDDELDNSGHEDALDAYQMDDGEAGTATIPDGSHAVDSDLPLGEQGVLHAFMAETRQQISSLQQQLQQQQQVFDEERELLLSAQGIEAARELYAMDVSLSVIKAVLRQVDRPHQAATIETILQVFSGMLPVIEQPQFGEGVYAVTGGRVAQQSATLAKLVLRVATTQSDARCVVLTLDEEHEIFSRFELLTGIKVISTEASRLGDSLAALSNYTHIFVDVGYSTIDSDNERGVVNGLAVLRDLNLNHRELLSLSSEADIAWTRGLIDHWRSDNTFCCLLSETDDHNGLLGQFISLLIEKRLPIIGFVNRALLPDAIQKLSKADLMSRLSQNRLMHRSAVAPFVS